MYVFSNITFNIVLIFRYNFFFHWLYSPLGPWPLLFSFMIILQTIGLLGRVINSSQGLYLSTGQHKHRTNIHALCGIRTHYPGFRASEDSTALDRSATVTSFSI
jgi:hypothetical protein